MNPVVTNILGGSYTTTQNSEPVSVARSHGAAVAFSYTNVAPSAKNFVAGVSEIDTLTFATKAATGDGDYISIVDTNGSKWGTWLKKVADVIDVQTITFPSKAGATSGDYVVINDTTGAKWAAALDKTGSAPEPTGAIWASIPADHKVKVAITAATDAASVATLVNAALNALAGFTSVITLSAPTLGAVTATQSVFGAVATDAPHNLGDTGAGSITCAVTLAGAGIAGPTGEIWATIPPAHRAVSNITGATTAANVATVARGVLAGLTGIGAVITVGAASGANVPLTHVARGQVADPTPSNKDDSAIGSITVVQTVAGVDSAVDATSNAVVVAGNSVVTGLKGQLTTSAGSLPGGLSLLTDYFLIVVDSTHVKFAASLVDALAGTPVDILDQGTAGSTFTFTATALAGGSVKLQSSIGGSVWFDISGKSANITATGSVMLELADVYYEYIRAVFTATAGQVQISAKVCTKDR
jgi:hypothetical protein